MFWIDNIISLLSWYWRGRTSDLHFEADGCSPSLTHISFYKVVQYCSKTTWTCSQSFEKRGALKISALTNLHVVEKRDQRLPFPEMKVMSCFILVFKPMLLNLATSVNRCLSISGFFFYFWSEISRLLVLKSLNYDYLSQMASLPINSLKASSITINDFQ